MSAPSPGVLPSIKPRCIRQLGESKSFNPLYTATPTLPYNIQESSNSAIVLKFSAIS